MPLGAARFGLLGGVADLGKLELIETQNVTTSTSYVDFTSLGSYNVHFITINDIDTNASTGINRFMSARFFESGVLESAGVYQYAHQYGFSNNTFGESKSTTSTSIPFGANVYSSTNSRSNSYCYFYNLTDNSKYSFMTYQDISVDGGANFLMNFGSGVLPQASSVDGIRFQLDNDNITNANFSLYGIAES